MRSNVRTVLIIVAGLAVGAGCNQHPLEHLSKFTDIGGVVSSKHDDRHKLDLLWVIDNSGSMCQEQANLARNFGAFADGVAELGVDLQIGVVTTDATDPAQSGRLQNTPAIEHDPSCRPSCDSDAACGGGCLCGVPHIRQCEFDAECDGADVCVAASGGQVRHCASPCDAPGADGCGVDLAKNRVLTCQRHPAATGGGLCMLTTCGSDSDCNGGQGQQCMQAADGLKYCRQAEAFCPPPTCDCPSELPTILSSSVGADQFEREFRCIASVGTGGDVFEKGLESMRKALSPQLIGPGGPNEGFLRDDAHLAVAFLSDENDCSDAGAPCDAPGERCQVCPDGVSCQGLGEDDTLICREDAVDATPWCRLPRRSPSECDRRSELLRPVADYARFLRSLKSESEDSFVAVAGIVGPAGDPEEITCVTPDGSAFSGGRYLELIEEFDDLGLYESICAEGADDGEFTEALEMFVEQLKPRLKGPICLQHRLRSCDADADCEGSCIRPEGEATPYCGDRATGLPEEAQARILADGPRQGRAEVEFGPGEGVRGHGCFHWLAGAPGPGETAQIVYRSELDLER